MPKVLNCCICGKTEAQMVISQFEDVAYCSQHSDRSGNEGGRILECIECGYRLDPGNAPWFYDVEEGERSCIVCKSPLNKSDVNIAKAIAGNRSSLSPALRAGLDLLNYELTNKYHEILASALARLIACKENNGRSWPGSTTLQICCMDLADDDEGAAQAKTDKEKEVYVAKLIVDIIVRIKGHRAKDLLRSWSPFWGGPAKALKKEAKKALKGLK